MRNLRGPEGEGWKWQVPVLGGLVVVVGLLVVVSTSLPVFHLQAVFSSHAVFDFNGSQFPEESWEAAGGLVVLLITFFQHCQSR